MSIVTPPEFLKKPFAWNGDKSIEIADDAISSKLGAFNYADGFPKITELPIDEGGIPPSREDMNLILNKLSQFCVYAQSGGMFSWNKDLNYSKPSIVELNDAYYFCIEDNGPDTVGGVREPGIDGSEAYWWQLVGHQYIRHLVKELHKQYLEEIAELAAKIEAEFDDLEAKLDREVVRLDKRVDDLTAYTKREVARLDARIDKEIEDRIREIDRVDKRIDKETSERKSADQQLQQAITELGGQLSRFKEEVTNNFNTVNQNIQNVQTNVNTIDQNFENRVGTVIQNSTSNTNGTLYRSIKTIVQENAIPRFNKTYIKIINQREENGGYLCSYDESLAVSPTLGIVTASFTHDTTSKYPIPELWLKRGNTSAPNGYDYYKIGFANPGGWHITGTTIYYYTARYEDQNLLMITPSRIRFSAYNPEISVNVTIM